MKNVGLKKPKETVPTELVTRGLALEFVFLFTTVRGLPEEWWYLSKVL